VVVNETVYSFLVLVYPVDFDRVEVDQNDEEVQLGDVPAPQKVPVADVGQGGTVDWEGGYENE
jgi:hypothetical protein